MASRNANNPSWLHQGNDLWSIQGLFCAQFAIGRAEGFSMWRITRTSGTLQQIFIMVAMNLLQAKRDEQLAIGRPLINDDDRGTPNSSAQERS